MRAAFVIAQKDLRQRMRDRSAIVAAFIAPLALAFIVSGAFGGGFSGSFSATYVVADEDDSELSRAFTEQVLGSPELGDQVRVESVRSPEEARERVTDGASAAFVIPFGFGEAVAANRKTTITVLRNPDAPIGSQVADALAGAFTAQVNAGRLSVLTTLRATGTGAPPDPDEISDLARAAAAERIPVQLTEGGVGVREVGGANYFGPAMAVFSLFFTTAFVARSLIGERQEGTLPRILAAPVRRSAVVIGKSMSAFVLGLLSLGVMFVTLGLVLGVDWGDRLALAVLSVVTVLAVMGLMTMVQTLARTQQGADASAQMLTITLALLGGNFFPVFQMPEAIQRLSALTPNGWALRGYSDIAYDGATIGDLGPHLLAIGAFAAVTGAIGILRARRIA